MKAANNSINKFKEVLVGGKVHKAGVKAHRFISQTVSGHRAEVKSHRFMVQTVSTALMIV
jgi:hypothetical protein